MAASGRPMGAGDDGSTFTFEQLALRVAVAVLGLVLLVTAIELGQVRGRVGRLEAGGAPAPAAAVEVPAGTPLTLNVENQGQVVHNLTLNGGPKTPDLKPGQKATLQVGTVTKAMTGECSIPGHKEAGMTFEVHLSGQAHLTATTAGAAADQADGGAKLDLNATPPAA